LVREGKHFATRSLPALLVSALLGLGAGGCGDAENASRSWGSTAPSAAAELQTGTTVSSTIPPGQRLRGDGDADNPSDIDGNGDSDSVSVGGPDTDNDNPTPESYVFPDRDDKGTFAYGHPPSATAGRAIADVVKRYYAAASVDDGAAACSLLLPSLAGSVPGGYGQGAGPSYLSGGKTCQAVLSMLFRHFHGELAEAIEVVEVRVKGDLAQAVLSSRTMRASSIFLTRRGGSWKIVALLGQPLP
jgi:hypothetical protein